MPVGVVRRCRHPIDGGCSMPAPITPEHEAETFAAQEAIAATLQHYIDGARTGDGGLMRRAFADSARISGTYGGKAVEWTAQEFCEIIDKNGPAAELAARVVAIEYAGNAAMARLEEPMVRRWIRTSSSGASGEADAFLPVK